MKRATKHLETFAIAVLAAGLSGCSCGDSLNVDNVSPEGSVGGIIVDAESRAPLAGASVALLAGGTMFEEVQTDDTGAFAFEKVPAGDVLVTITAPEGYRSIWLRDELPNAAGEFPTGNSSLTLGPIGLVPMSETFSVRVLDQYGKPVSQYPMALEHFNEWVDFSGGTPIGRGSVQVEATTDSSGYANFTNIPNMLALSTQLNDTVVVLLPPLDEDSNNVYEYGGGDRIFHLRALADPTPDVVLDSGFTTVLQIRNSTIAQMAGTGGTHPLPAVLAINDVIHFAFNLPIQPSAEITISDEFGAAITQTPALSITGDYLAINFNGDPLLPGNEYNIHIHAVASVGERLVEGDFAGSFFTPGVGAAVTVDSITRDGSNRVDLEFSEPIGTVASVNLTGEAGCVTFFPANLADVSQTGYVGDAPGELNNPSCAGYNMYSNEPDPEGLPGPSGYTKYWYFIDPIDITLTTPATGVHLLFSHVSNQNYIMQRPNGVPVEDFTGTTSIAIP